MHWLHSVDQIIYRLGSACFTYTEFARLLYELREDRRHALAMAHAESHRSGSRQTLSTEVVKDKEETQANKLRAQATILEDGARNLIALPALYAARLELKSIEFILTQVEPHVRNIPFAFQECQQLENTLALLWKYHLEMRTYNQPTFDTLSEISARGLVCPNLSNWEISRDNFLNNYSSSSIATHKLLRTPDLHGFYALTIEHLKADDDLLIAKYTEALTDEYSSQAVLGLPPTGIRTFATAKGLEGRSSGLPDGPARP